MQRPEHPKEFYSNAHKAAVTIEGRAIERVIIRRESLGLSQAQLAEKAEMTLARIIEIETGQWHMRYADMILLAAALDTDLDYFTEGALVIAKKGLHADRAQLEVVGEEAG